MRVVLNRAHATAGLVVRTFRVYGLATFRRRMAAIADVAHYLTCSLLVRINFHRERRFASGASVGRRMGERILPHSYVTPPRIGVEDEVARFRQVYLIRR